MHRSTRLLALVAGALLVPAAGASAATFSGTTDQGVPITFTAQGDQVSGLQSSLTMVCTGRSGIEVVQPSGTFVANGAESKFSELRPSAVLNRDATQNFGFTGTISGAQASGKISLNYATTNFDLFTMTTTIIVCDGSATFSATSSDAVAPPPAQTEDKPAHTTPTKKKKKAPTKKKPPRKKKGGGGQAM